MDSGGTSLLATGVWVIPLVVILLLVGSYWLVRRWQAKTPQELKPVLPALNAYRAERISLEVAIQDYSGQDPEPFGTRAEAVRGQLAEIDEQIDLFKQSYVVLQMGVRKLSLNRWQAMIGAPFFWYEWYRLRKDVASLNQAVSAFQDHLVAARQAAQEIKGQGWVVALEAREVGQIASQAGQLLDQLRQNLRGEMFETALRQEARLRQSLAQIPEFFFTAPEQDVLLQATKPGITQVYSLLAQVRPELDKLLEKIQSWESQYAEIAGKVAGMRQLLGEVGQLMENMPAELALHQHQARFRPLATISDSLRGTLSRLEVESLRDVARETERVHRTAQDIGNQLRRARRNLAALEPLLAELQAGLGWISNQFAALGTRPVYPLVWDLSRDRFTELSRQAAAIGPIKKQRTPEQVDKDLSAARALNAAQKELADHCQEVDQQHVALLALLEGPEIRQGLAWCQASQDFAAQVAAYDPVNWPRIDDVANLTTHLRELSLQHQNLVPSTPSSPIRESELPGLLEQVRGLGSRYQSLHVRLGNIQARLTDLQSVERQAHDRLQEMEVFLQQIEPLVGSNAFLSELAMAEIGRFRDSLQQVDSLLEQKRRGTLSEKAKGVNALADKIVQAGNAWLDKLNQDIENRKKGIADKLEQLGKVATLDERGIYKAENLLAQDLQATAASRGRQSSAIPMKDLLGQIKPRSDTWQACVATVEEIKEIEAHVTDLEQQVSQQREKAQILIAGLDKLVPDRTSWPPTSQVPGAERQQLAQLDDERQAVRDQRASLPRVVRRLTELVAGYSTLADKAERVAQRAEQEQNRIRSLEADLEQLSQRWQTQEAAYANDRQAVRAIQNLRNDVRREQENIRRSWTSARRSETLSYDEVLQFLIALARDFQSAGVMVGEDEEQRQIGIDGEVWTPIRPNRWR